jgi:hypothetical protein
MGRTIDIITEIGHHQACLDYVSFAIADCDSAQEHDAGGADSDQGSWQTLPGGVGVWVE